MDLEVFSTANPQLLSRNMTYFVIVSEHFESRDFERCKSISLFLFIYFLNNPEISGMCRKQFLVRYLTTSSVDEISTW